LARRAGCSRFSVGRWIAGRADPTLPEFLKVLDAATERLLDFVGSFVDPLQLPSIATFWAGLLQAREAAYAQPWSHAVLRALDLDEYGRLDEHRIGWIAGRLGITAELEQECLELLEETHQIEWAGTLYKVIAPLAVDTRFDPKRARALRAGWAEEGIRRLRQDAPGLLSYNLSTVSRHDLRRIEQLQRAHYRQLVTIIAESSPAECVLLYTAQVVELGGTAEPRTR
jgi:hypothetical protein